jgi:hypothetical protein
LKPPEIMVRPTTSYAIVAKPPVTPTVATGGFKEPDEINNQRELPP